MSKPVARWKSNRVAFRYVGDGFWQWRSQPAGIDSWQGQRQYRASQDAQAAGVAFLKDAGMWSGGER